MTDRLKHQLYDAFLKNTPITFESVTDEQWAALQSTIIGFGVTLTAIFQDVSEAITNIFKAGK